MLAMAQVRPAKRKMSTVAKPFVKKQQVRAAPVIAQAAPVARAVPLAAAGVAVASARAAEEKREQRTKELSKIRKPRVVAWSAKEATTDAFIKPDARCLNTNCEMELTREEVKAGWSSDPMDNRITCPHCQTRFVGYLEISTVGPNGQPHGARWPWLCRAQLAHAMRQAIGHPPGVASPGAGTPAQWSAWNYLEWQTVLATKQEIYWNAVDHYGSYVGGLIACFSLVKWKEVAVGYNVYSAKPGLWNAGVPDFEQLPAFNPRLCL